MVEAYENQATVRARYIIVRIIVCVISSSLVHRIRPLLPVQ